MQANDSRNSKPSFQFGPPEETEAQWLIGRAIEEDVPRGDITSDALFSAPAPGSTEPQDRECCVRMRFVSREAGVLCGLALTPLLYRRIDPKVRLLPLQADGDQLEAGTVIAEISGPAASILGGERIALNFLQRLSGIATTTARWRQALAGWDTVLLDTRKTTPGWRYLEKYAVRVGGGTNHRFNLSDGYLVKDNHLWILRARGRADPREWIAELRRKSPEAFLQVEVDTRDDFLSIRRESVDAILLDNFGEEDLRWAVETNKALGEPRPQLEASGGIRLASLARIAATGVDRISAGALTHSAVSLDISLDCSELCDSVNLESKGES